MTDRELQIAENLSVVRERIESARRVRGDGREVKLLAATKTVPAEDIIFAADELGLRLGGENRAQEFNEKYEAVSPHLDEYHFIGHLQTNKVKYVVGRAALIHSVSSVRLAREISRVATAKGIVQRGLLELNCAREEAKSGFFPEEISEAIAEISTFSGIEVCGIMTMGPAGAEKGALRKYFQETYAIFIDNFEKKPHNIRETVLSMGMSDSYELAIEEGATLVRVGSAIFGKRFYP